jgi:hypothetical protein
VSVGSGMKWFGPSVCKDVERRSNPYRTGIVILYTESDGWIASCAVYLYDTSE